MKTIKEWLEKLPDGYRELALERIDSDCFYVVAVSMDDAIGSFDWGETYEGYEFWCDVYEHYANGSPLPPLPASASKEEHLKAYTALQDELRKVKVEAAQLRGSAEALASDLEALRCVCHAEGWAVTVGNSSLAAFRAKHGEEAK